MLHKWLLHKWLIAKYHKLLLHKSNKLIINNQLSYNNQYNQFSNKLYSNNLELFSNNLSNKSLINLLEEVLLELQL